MKSSEVKIGDLISTDFGLLQVMKFIAPAFVACVVLTPNENRWRQKEGQGEWVYIRGLDFDRAEIVR